MFSPYLLTVAAALLIAGSKIIRLALDL